MGLMGGLNNYQYNINPILYIDPLGLHGGVYMMIHNHKIYVGKGNYRRMRTSITRNFPQFYRKRLMQTDIKHLFRDFSEPNAIPGLTDAIKQKFNLGSEQLGFIMEYKIMSMTQGSHFSLNKISSPGRDLYHALPDDVRKLFNDAGTQFIDDFENGGRCKEACKVCH
nr:hypothetical protein [Taylorella asinigenitalis]